MSKWNYIASAHKASAVAASLVANFTASDDRNLLIAKGSRIEVHSLAEDNVIPLHEFSLFGTVLFLDKLHSQGISDSLLIATEPFNLSLATYENGKLIIKESTPLKERQSVRLEYFPFASLDPYQRAYALHIYKGLIRIVAIKSNLTLGIQFNARIEEHAVVDMKILNNIHELHLAIMFSKGDQFTFKVFPISLAEKNFSEVIWCINIREPCTKFLSLEFGAVGILDANSIKVYRESEIQPSSQALAEFGNVIVTHKVDNERWIVSNLPGLIFIVFITNSTRVECLGRCSSASSISYLDNNFFFIGSAKGDSQLIKVLQERQGNSFISIEQKYENIGPILDFKVIEGERKGLCNIVSCSGFTLDGTLRLVNKGISVTNEIEMAIGNVVGLFTLQVQNEEFFTHIVLSFIDGTRIIKNQDEVLKPINYPNVDPKISSIYIAVTQFGIIQVTKGFAQLLDFEWNTLYKIHSNDLLENSHITLATSSENKLCLVLNGNELIEFSISHDSLIKKGNWTALNEIACIGMSIDFVAVGLWIELNIIVFKCEGLSEY